MQTFIGTETLDDKGETFSCSLRVRHSEMRFWLCFALLACGTESPPSPVPPIAAPGPAPSRVTPPPLTAAHGSEIVAIAVTTDGTAVASADRLGGIRLWPVLDGTREPVVIHGTAPRAMALARDGDGFALTALDDAGGVHIMRTSAAGAIRERVTVTADQRALEIDSTPDGLLVLRADQTLLLVDSAGQIRARLEPDPGVHIDSLLVRGRRVLALVQESKRLRGQWIELADGMHWGAPTPSFTAKVAHAVLSPDGKLLAVTRPRSLHPRLIDLATGATLKTPLCVPRQWPADGDSAADLLRNDNTPVPLGFLDATVVACSVTGTLQWWNTEGNVQPTQAGTFSLGTGPVDISDRALVVGLGPALGMASLSVNKFLGYGLHDVEQLHGGASGVLISGSNQQALLLDDRLRERARFEQGSNQLDWSTAALVDDRYALITTTRRGSSRDNTYQLAVFDGVARVQHQLLPYDLREPTVTYERSTGLLSARDASGPMLLRLDPTTHTFGKPTTIASWIPPSRLHVVDPTLSGGVAALALDYAGDGILVAELALADIQPGAAITARTTYRVPGELRAADRAGRLYMRGATSETTVYQRGAIVARLPALDGMALYPSRDGSRIAAFQSPRLVMLTATGQVRWEAALWNSADIEWTPSDDLVVRYLSGLAKLDLATGSLAERRCGWSFGLTDVPVDAGRPIPSICEAAR